MSKKIPQTLYQMILSCTEIFSVANIVEMLKIHLELINSKKYTEVIIKLEEAVELLLNLEVNDTYDSQESIHSEPAYDFAQFEPKLPNANPKAPVNHRSA